MGQFQVFEEVLNSVAMTLPREHIEALCREFGVERLSVFGSAVTDSFDPAHSDVDFLVEFSATSRTLRHYFGFRDALEQLLGRPVDLVVPKALRNPYFASAVAQTRQELYAAA